MQERGRLGAHPGTGPTAGILPPPPVRTVEKEWRDRVNSFKNIFQKVVFEFQKIIEIKLGLFLKVFSWILNIEKISCILKGGPMPGMRPNMAGLGVQAQQPKVVQDGRLVLTV